MKNLGRLMGRAIVLFVMCCFVSSTQGPVAWAVEGGASEDGGAGVPERLSAAPLWWDGTFLPIEATLAEAQDANGIDRRHYAPAIRGGVRLAYDAILEHDLFTRADLVLPGVESRQSITFSRPRMWKVLDGTELRLQIDHSGVLIPERSHLTILLNDKNIRSIRLDESNEKLTEIRIPIPVGALRDYNKLELVVQQHYTNDCEDPFDPALWTKVSKASAIHFEYEFRPVTEAGLRFPMPIFDRLAFGPTVLWYVLPDVPSPATINEMARLTAGFGQRVAYGSIALGQPVKRVADAPGHAIVIGLPSENPEIGRLVGSQLNGLEAGAGLVSLLPNPSNPYTAVLVVTGRDEDGLRKAVTALTSSPSVELLSGGTSIIRAVDEGRPPKMRVKDGFIPPSPEYFTLKDVGFSNTTVRGFYASPIRFDLNSLPDYQYYARSPRLRLYYGYSAQLENNLSSLEIRMGNVTLYSAPLDDPRGLAHGVLDISIPVEILNARNNIEFVFNLFPRGYDRCREKEDKQIWGTIFADSVFYMPHYYWAQMPDLGNLQYGMYPFGLFQDLSRTAIVLPDAPLLDDVMAGLSVAAELGRWTHSDRIALRMAGARNLSEQVQRQSNLILVHTGRTHSQIQNLTKAQHLILGSNQKQLLGDSRTREVLSAYDPNTHGTIEQVLSPYGKGKVITVLQGFSPENFRRALRMFTDVRISANLKPNSSVALMGPDNQLRTLRIGQQTAFGSIPLSVRLQQWGEHNMVLVIALLILGLLLLFIILKLILGQYRRNEHGGPRDPDDGGGAGPSPMDRDPYSGNRTAAAGARGASAGPSAAEPPPPRPPLRGSAASAGEDVPPPQPRRRLPPRRVRRSGPDTGQTGGA